MRTVGRYEVLGELARGGMGGVHLAHDPEGAVVVLKTQANSDDDDRLVDEARIGARLRHPNIVETKELLTVAGRPVLVLGYVPGVTLHVCRRAGRLPTPVLARVFRQIAEALDAIHAATDERGVSLNIIHRDVTPANIIVGYDGDARLIDLGIARFTESSAERTTAGMFRGTLRYIAPEILAGDKQSPRSDVWALGLTLFEAALGRRAAHGSEAEVLGAIFQGRILDVEPGETFSDGIYPIIAAACHKDPTRRATASQIALMLRGIEMKFGDSRAPCARFVAEVAEAAVTNTTSTQSRLIAEAQAAWGGHSEESGPIMRQPPRTSFEDVASTVVDGGFSVTPPTVVLAGNDPFAAQLRLVEPDPWDLPPPITGAVGPDEEVTSTPAPIEFADSSDEQG